MPDQHTSPPDSKTQTPLRGFWSLIVTQFQGAFSDNVLKNLAIFMILGASVSLEQKHVISEQVTALFSLPFILFSMTGGYLADRFSKRTITVGVKIFEVAVMTLALVGLATRQLHIVLATVFLMGLHSAIFGPSKYGLLPEILPEKRLSWGNGILELGTFMAIILGSALAGVMHKHFKDTPAWSGILLILLAFIGLGTSLGITRVPAANPARRYEWNFVKELWGRLKWVRGDRPLTLAVIGNTYFTFLGMLLMLNVFFVGDEVLHVEEDKIGLLLTALALGIGLGSVAAGYLSGNKIEYGLVPLGAFGLFVLCMVMAAGTPTYTSVFVELAVLGFFGGFFIVPVSALLQHRPDPDKKGEILAAANLLSFVGMFLASGAHYLMSRAHCTPQQVFLVSGILTLAGAVYALWLLPEALMRFILWTVTRTIYRIRVDGAEHIPSKSGALLVCNHLSFVDALLLIGSTDRNIRFIMYKGIYESPVVRPFARIMQAIPISSELRPREMIASLKTASEAIRQGDIVCIFAEGQITRIGHMLPFRRGFERIMKDVEAPIIPVALDGVWGSIFSFEKGRFLWKMPRRFPYPVTVNYGAPMPHNATPIEVRQQVQDLMAEAWTHRRERMMTLHRGFIRKARHHPWRTAMVDSQDNHVCFGSALMKTVFLARRLRRIWAGQEMIGLLLPPSPAGALVNLAALMMGKVPVNLNYTVSAEVLASCVQQCHITTIITSRAFLDKVKLTLPFEPVYLEDIAANPGAGEKFLALITAFTLPAWLLEKIAGRVRPVTLDSLATVIFSSGSTGDPKGVMLTHYNIGSNIEQLEQVFALGRRDGILGVLPFFHSFGFTGTLCLPAVLGVKVVYHPNPLDAKVIGPLVGRNAITFLLATPTFLQFYMRTCSPEDFGSLRVVMTAAEKLPDRLATAFEDQYGIRPLEGYGCTECSPAVAVNALSFRSAGFRQVGAKRGKIGHPLPGMCVQIVDPDTRQPLPTGQPGLMLVRGPNVMAGYLNRPEKTAEVLHDGWYSTGDIAALDEDGFLQITDRLSRFSKIGGEMVPHIKVEEKLHELAGVTEQTFVVAGVPDEKKGERLVVLHRLPEDRLQQCLAALAQCNLPNLWKPRPDQFIRVESFPFLGTGKLDLRAVREWALKRSVSPDTSTPLT
jgi:acyl-[acyl-carrier-protein]-phospholipid O-acyltransferase/long-chain-fatty-acid--[acyl-carrier-protein] ligase